MTREVTERQSSPAGRKWPTPYLTHPVPARRDRIDGNGRRVEAQKQPTRAPLEYTAHPGKALRIASTPSVDIFVLHRFNVRREDSALRCRRLPSSTSDPHTLNCSSRAHFVSLPRSSLVIRVSSSQSRRKRGNSDSAPKFLSVTADSDKTSSSNDSN